MIIDARSLPQGQVLQADLCIVGGGAAGLTVAQSLLGSGLSIIVLEAGGRRFEPAAQEGLQGAVAEGSPHPTPDLYRRRMLGGATSIWGGRCVPLDPIDLERRAWVENSGWPIGWEELQRHYPAALAACDAGSWGPTVAEALGEAAPPSIAGFAHPDILSDGLERFSRPTDFGRAAHDRLAAAPEVQLLLHAQALKLVAPRGPVERLEAASAPGRSFTIRARRYVLAGGGLEVPRLLMASDGSRRGGLGNEGGALGRFYMCHVENTLGLLRFDPVKRPVALHFETTAEGIYVRRRFAVAAEAQRREGLMNTIFRLHYPLIADPSHGSGVLSAMYLVKDLIIPEYRRKLAAVERAERGRMTRDAGFWARHLGNLLRDAPGVAHFGQDWIRRRILASRKLPFVVMPSRAGAYPLDINAEQVPDADNRVTLTDQRDAHGMPRLSVDWRLKRADIDSLTRSMLLIRDAFAQSGCATLELDTATLEQAVAASTPVGGHHIGTTRMASSPREGVVDADCAVHGAPNLFVASASVFPSCGHANPTLTVVALALRLAAHLRATAATATAQGLTEAAA
ncbi:GMC oxidoreductase [Roseomonas sp. USHLN139]|uniref:GMC oxidoreductase n=1 Tax=Roseomonas sp. USHLN139 TaxID=3081298 RepID=UPI003B02359C